MFVFKMLQAKYMNNNEHKKSIIRIVDILWMKQLIIGVLLQNKCGTCTYLKNNSKKNSEKLVKQ